MIRAIDILHIAPLVLGQLQFHVDRVITLVLDIVKAIENLFLVEHHNVQDTLNFLINEETLDRITILLSKMIAIVLFLDLNLENNSILEILILLFVLHKTTFTIFVPI